ncbi:MAG: hypothetical protein ACEQR8_11765, partial [Cypionkella sp.]
PEAGEGSGFAGPGYARKHHAGREEHGGMINFPAKANAALLTAGSAVLVTMLQSGRRADRRREPA